MFVFMFLFKWVLLVEFYFMKNKMKLLKFNEFLYVGMMFDKYVYIGG